MLVSISSGVSEYLATLSSLFAASADHRFQFKKRGQLFIRTHNETLSASEDRARILFDFHTANDPAMINKEKDK